MNHLLILNGTIVNSTSVLKKDIAVSNGSIVDIGHFNPLSFPGFQVIDASFKILDDLG